MGERPPAVSVVVATRDRVDQLAAMLDGLRAQRDAPPFEVVVVEDDAGDRTDALLAAARDRGDLDLNVVRRDVRGGPARARNDGWRAARAPLVAFTDDDCVPAAGWVAAVQGAAALHPGAIIQGRTDPNPAELHRLGPFSRTLRVNELGPFFQTCNIAYPRPLLERLEGFDERYGVKPGGEDTDLAWRALEEGVPAEYVPEAQVFHTVARLGPLGILRVAARWTDSMQVYGRHPELRAAVFTHRLFWKPEHYLLCRTLIAVALPRRRRLIRRWLAWPYLVSLLWRSLQRDSRGPVLIPYLVLHDLVELGAVGRAMVRYRIAVL
jgi:GT2 family glycosyltransferase